MKKHGFIAAALVALSLAVMALPVAAMAESADVDESVEFYASNICPATSDGKHVYVRVSAQDATCTEEGHTRGLSCSACGEVFVESTTIPALDHDFSEAVNEVPATCTADGTTGGWKCTRCDATKGVEKIPATGHSWGDWETTQEATCTATGVKTRACQNAGCTETETKDIPALGHNWTKKDSTNHECTRCGETEAHSFVDGKCEDCGYKKASTGGNSSSGSSHHSSSSDGLDNVPKTGDVTPIFAYGIVMLLSAAAIVIRRIRLAR